MRTWHPVGIVVGVSVAACFVKPDPPQGMAIDAGSGSSDLPDARDDGGGGGDVLPTTCTPYTMDVAGTTKCGGWASTASNASVGSGLLNLTAPQSPNSELAVCMSNEIAFQSVTLDIASLTLITHEDAMKFHVINGTSYYGVRIHIPSGGTAKVLDAECNGTSLTTPTLWSVGMARYVRLRWVNGAIAIETSASLATPFSVLTTCPVVLSAVTSVIRLDLSRAAGGSAMSATFESLEICE